MLIPSNTPSELIRYAKDIETENPYVEVVEIVSNEDGSFTFNVVHKITGEKDSITLEKQEED